MTAYDMLATASGIVGISAGAVFFALWQSAAARSRRWRRKAFRATTALRNTPTVEQRTAGAPVHRPNEPLPEGQTVVLPLRPHVRRVNGSL